ncbi:ArsR/SmtB family transcription factor [Luteimonas suaedae]|uniref:ArsR/SmtB family transcription factor n=1 Tax=Luteimonas suaedae TaxID=2605430 RepID=UPI0011F07618|nr:metalloregulator ArsR/SmtB family transcription factor [Luteimonas suaedae]
METNAALDALSALAQKSRLAVFRRLVELGPAGATPGELAEAVGIAATTLSFHLRTLAQAGLIAAEQNGRSITYRADFAAMQDLVGYLTENCCGGDPELCAPVPARRR